MKERKEKSRLDTMFEDAVELVSSSRNFAFGKILVDRDDLVNLFSELEKTIPKEVDSARAVLLEREKIITEAKKEASVIRERAKAEADRLMDGVQAEVERKLSAEEITRQAMAMAEETKAEVDRYAQETKLEAENYAQQVRDNADVCALKIQNEVLQYADDVLVYLSGTLQSSMDNLSGTLQSSMDSILANRENIAAHRQSKPYNLYDEEKESAPENKEEV